MEIRHAREYCRHDHTATIFHWSLLHRMSHYQETIPNIAWKNWREKIVRYYCCHFTITRSSYRIFNLMENFVDPWQDNLYNLIFFLTTTNSLIEYTYIAVPSAKHTWPMAERYWAGSTRESPTRLPPPPPLTHHSSCQVSNPFEVFFIKNSQFCIWK